MYKEKKADAKVCQRLKYAQDEKHTIDVKKMRGKSLPGEHICMWRLYMKKKLTWQNMRWQNFEAKIFKDKIKFLFEVEIFLKKQTNEKN